MNLRKWKLRQKHQNWKEKQFEFSYIHKINIKKDQQRALAGVAQWIEHGPADQRVASSIPSQGTCLGCGPGPQ